MARFYQSFLRFVKVNPRHATGFRFPFISAAIKDIMVSIQMETILIVGIIITVGFVFGELATKVKLPKVTGYILAGVFLDPDVSHFISKDFVNSTAPVTNIALAVIAFSVGGSLLYPRIKALGKGILNITVFEAEFAFIIVTIGFLLTVPFFFHAGKTEWFATFFPASILIAALASPTDPAAAFAVKEEYNAEGNVTSTVMGVAALDDVLGIINYSFAVVIAATVAAHQAFSVYSSIIDPLITIVGSTVLGVGFGFLFNTITWLIRKEKEGVFIVIIIGLLALCFGISDLINVDAILAIMVMGIVVVNFNKNQEKIFGMLERYTDELIFVLFFTLCGMQLDFSVFTKCFLLILLFAIFRIVGKFLGTLTGAYISKSPKEVKLYTIGGLVPQGGIIIGLALMIKQNPAFSTKTSDIIISIIIGSTVIHELLGPITAKIAFKKAGEIK